MDDYGSPIEGATPSLFMTATLHIEPTAIEMWRALGAKSTRTPIFADGRGSSGYYELGSLERAPDSSDRKHARLRLFVLPVGHTSGLDNSQISQIEPDLSSVVREAMDRAEPNAVTFDCLGTVELDLERFQPRVPIPSRVWETVDPLFSTMVGARFAFRRRGLTDSWAALDIIEGQLRAQVSFEKSFSIASATRGAWKELSLILPRLVRARK